MPEADPPGVAIPPALPATASEEQQESERRGHHQQLFLEAVLESLSDGIVACDATGTLTLFNAATRAMHGLPEKPLPPESWAEHYDLFHADGITPLDIDEIPLFRAYRGEHVNNAEMAIVPKGGEPRILLASGRPILDEQGQHLGAVVAMHDVTDQRRSAAALREAALREQRMRTEARQAEQMKLLNSAAVSVVRPSTLLEMLDTLNEEAAKIVGVRHSITSVDLGPEWSRAVTSVALSKRYASLLLDDQTADAAARLVIVCETGRPVRLSRARLKQEVDRQRESVLLEAPLCDEDGSEPGLSQPSDRPEGQFTEEDGFEPGLIRPSGILSVPLCGEDGSNLGMIQLSGKLEGQFTGADEALLVQLAQLASLAIEKIRLYEREHSIAETLQRSLLPASFPEIPGLRVAARYLPGAAGVAVGGDWYDLFALAGGRLGVAVGDVEGRGLAAAATMGQLRVALRAHARETNDPAAVLDRVNQLVEELEATYMATVVFAVVEADLGSLRFCNAGHSPPLLIQPDGSAGYLTGALGAPLGLGVERSNDTVHLRPGSVILLYTDGLVDRRDLPIDQGLTTLLETVREHRSQHRCLESLCDAVLKQLLCDGPSDDVALLVIEVVNDPSDCQ
ncbi:MAG: SpoIIE family protein phosphatase [Actinomycetota bacterium]